MPRRTAVVVSLLVLAACRKDSESANASASATEDRGPTGVATIHAAELAVPGRGAVQTVDVENDRAALVVVGEGAKSKRPIIHLHGMCSEAQSDLEAWSSTVRGYGTIVALEGDLPCGTGTTAGLTGRTWSQDASALDRRIAAAIAAIRAVRVAELDASEIIVIGESMGATRATALAARAPERYARLVLIGAPEELLPEKLATAKAVAVLAGEHEPHGVPQQNFEALEAAGLRTRFWTLTGADHGEYGASGATTMGEALAFVTR
ncbi:MAG: alpha/beta fold hydrolase [Labilithrix sp.]